MLKIPILGYKERFTMINKDHIIKEAEQIICRYEKRYESEFGLYDQVKNKKKAKLRRLITKSIFVSLIFCFLIIWLIKSFL